MEQQAGGLFSSYGELAPVDIKIAGPAKGGLTHQLHFAAGQHAHAHKLLRKALISEATDAATLALDELRSLDGPSIWSQGRGDRVLEAVHAAKLLGFGLLKQETSSRSGQGQSCGDSSENSLGFASVSYFPRYIWPALSAKPSQACPTVAAALKPTMNILVCIAKVPDTTAKISFTGDGTAFDESGVQFILNPYDEWYALVRAIELTEGGKGTTTVVNVGPSSNDAIIRKALAIGADRAARIDLATPTTYEVANAIADFARDKNYDLILTGKETIDYNGSEVGAMIAELLDLPYVSYASKLDVAGTTATIRRDIEGGVETLEVDLPAVVSAAKGMAEQRIPNMRGIMMAKQKPLDVVTPAGVSALTRVSKYELPDNKGSVRMIDPDNMDELVRLLHEEAKVI